MNLNSSIGDPSDGFFGLCGPSHRIIALAVYLPLMRTPCFT
jgi:hypothetical protein